MNEFKSIAMQVQANKNVDPSFSSYLQFFYILNGNVSIEVSNMIYHLEKDDLIMIPPYLSDEHSGHSARQTIRT